MKREIVSVNHIDKIISKYPKDSIMVINHYLDYLNEGSRDLSPETIKEFLAKKDCYFVEKQTNKFIRYKIIFELSKKYDLIIVIEEEQKGLKVVTAYKTNKKIKEKWEKMSKSFMRK